MNILCVIQNILKFIPYANFFFFYSVYVRDKYLVICACLQLYVIHTFVCFYVPNGTFFHWF